MAITQRTLTTGEVEGSGIFDELMRTVQAHCQRELDEERINTQSYSQVYLGSLQSTLQVANQYALSYEKANKDLELADEQIAQSKKQNDLLELQKEKLEIEIDTARYNLDFMLPKQLELLNEQIAQAKAQSSLIGQQELQASAQTDMIGKQEDLVDKQILTEEDKTSDPTGGLNKAAYDKTQAEIEILGQKKLTEQKQTSGTIEDTNGLIGYEMHLKQVQGDSFLRDAEQKATKMYTDIFSVMYSTNAEGLNPQNFGFGSDEAFNAATKLLEGIGAPAPNRDQSDDHRSTETTS